MCLRVVCPQKYLEFNDVLNWKIRVVLQSLLQCNIHKWSTASHVFDFPIWTLDSQLIVQTIFLNVKKGLRRSPLSQRSNGMPMNWRKERKVHGSVCYVVHEHRSLIHCFAIILTHIFVHSIYLSYLILTSSRIKYIASDEKCLMNVNIFNNWFKYVYLNESK